MAWCSHSANRSWHCDWRVSVPFHYADASKRPSILARLPPLPLHPGADIHAKDKHGKTLLQFPKDDKVFRFLYDIDRAELLKPSAMYQRPQGVRRLPGPLLCACQRQPHHWPAAALQ